MDKLYIILPSINIINVVQLLNETFHIKFRTIVNLPKNMQHSYYTATTTPEELSYEYAFETCAKDVLRELDNTTFDFFKSY